MRVRELKQELDERLDALQRSLDERFDARFAALNRAMDERFHTVATRFEAADERFERLEAKIDSVAADTRRHFDIVSGQLRSDIALLASSVLASNERLDTSISSGKSEPVVLVSALDDHELRLRILERSR